MKKTIMTVDDSASIRLMVNLTLRELDYEIVMAENGRHALDKLEKKQIHMLITDINMPQMDGIRLIKNVRELPSCKFIPIIVFSSESEEEKQLEAKAAGATAWIAKPFKANELIAVVKKVMG